MGKETEVREMMNQRSHSTHAQRASLSEKKSPKARMGESGGGGGGREKRRWYEELACRIGGKKQRQCETSRRPGFKRLPDRVLQKGDKGRGARKVNRLG